MAFGPSRTAATTGPLVMKSTRLAEERLGAVDGVVALGELAVDGHELEADEPQAALLVAGEDPADEQALDAVGLDEDEGAFGHGSSRDRIGASHGAGWAAFRHDAAISDGRRACSTSRAAPPRQ